jgi:hypothetical protein
LQIYRFRKQLEATGRASSFQVLKAFCMCCGTTLQLGCLFDNCYEVTTA